MSARSPRGPIDHTASAADVLERRRTWMTAWFGVVVFAYYYKAVVCGFVGDVFNADCICDASVRGISTNHWFEIVVYAPLLWLALHQVNAAVFGDPPLEGVERLRHRRRQLVGECAIAFVIYGTGIHIANVIEIYSRERQAITDGNVYDLVYFLDEDLSHYVQFVPLFFVIGWFIIHDRVPRPEHATLALLFGVGHGVERAVGIIEGGKWFLGPPMIAWLAFALLLRTRRLRATGADARTDFFARYALAFCLVFPVALGAYALEVGSFTPPSELSDGQSATVAIGAAILTIGGTALPTLAERRWGSRGQQAGV